MCVVSSEPMQDDCPFRRVCSTSRRSAGSREKPAHRNRCRRGHHQEQRDGQPHARVEARGIVLTLPGSVYFDTGRADVKKGAAERVARIAEALAGAPDRKLIVEGHTDSTGSTATNEKLSNLRAEAVKAILVAHGVSPDRIETHGYAATKPVASNDTAEGRAENRRVEVIPK